MVRIGESALVNTIVSNDIKISGVEMDRENLEKILSELQRRRSILVSIANNSDTPLDNTDPYCR